MKIMRFSCRAIIADIISIYHKRTRLQFFPRLSSMKGNSPSHSPERILLVRNIQTAMFIGSSQLELLQDFILRRMIIQEEKKHVFGFMEKSLWLETLAKRAKCPSQGAQPKPCPLRGTAALATSPPPKEGWRKQKF